MAKHPDWYRRHDLDRKFLMSRQWREKIRPAQFARSPVCEHCRLLGIIRIAEEVDHIRRPEGDGLLQRDPDNFQSLCKEHHLAKSNWERDDQKKPLRIGTDPKTGYPVELPGGRVERREEQE